MLLVRSLLRRLQFQEAVKIREIWTWSLELVSYTIDISGDRFTQKKGNVPKNISLANLGLEVTATRLLFIVRDLLRKQCSRVNVSGKEFQKAEQS